MARSSSAASDYRELRTPLTSSAAPADAKRPPAADFSTDDDDNTTASPAPPTRAAPSFLALYRFATPGDVAALALAAASAALNGALFPCMALVFGDAVSAFAPFDRERVHRAALDYLRIALALFATDVLAHTLFARAAERQVKRLREHALRRLLRRGVAWFDRHDALQLASRLAGDTLRIKSGMGQKLGEAVKSSGQFLGGFAIGFAKGWDIALVMCCATPVMVATLSMLLSGLRVRATRSQQLYAEAGAVAEEALAAMRTVASLTAEPRALAQYAAKTATVERENIAFFRKAALVNGVYTSSLWLIYAAGLWYGGVKVYSGRAAPGPVFQAFFGVLLGAQSMGQISPSVAAIAEATGAAAALFAVLDDAEPDEPSEPDRGGGSGGLLEPAACSGAVDFESVDFAYPSRPAARVLRQFSVRIRAGETVAFVGPSGGGKSTLVALLERFYAPTRGCVRLDGRDIQTLDVSWLRARIGLVAQEPVLFAMSIFDNIAAGGGGVVSREQAEAAARLANAHEFILALPQGYDTLVGEKGVALSGGQKQRVALARALVREPKILVLDEATSALDAASERVVQAALDRLLGGATQLTTLVVAHRLSTVRGADRICVVRRGAVVEQGRHEELMALPAGEYRKLYALQQAEVAGSEASAASAPTPTALGLDGARDIVVGEMKQRCVSSVPSGRAGSPDEPPPTAFTVRAAMALSRPERAYFVRGIVAAGLNGFSVPASALLISELLAAMNTAYEAFAASRDRAALRETLEPQVTAAGLGYLGGAVALFFVHSTQIYSFRFMAEKLTSRLRALHLRSLLRQDVAFFDEPAYAPGALAAELATSATKVSLVSGDAQGRVLQAAFTFAAAVALSFATGSWLLTLVLLAVFPLVLLGEVLRFASLKGSGVLSDELAESSALASEALCNVRTVLALGLEAETCRKYAALLEAPLRRGQREARHNGLALGFSSFVLFAAYALVFWYGGELVSKGAISFKQLIRSLMAIMMAAQGVAYAAAWLGEAAHALQAGAAIFAVRDRELTIDSFDGSGLKPARVHGRLELQDVTFWYPTRPAVTVLTGCNVVVEAGQTVAFCGPSGGGKSTIVALLERFYDPVRGDVLLDGHNVKDLNLNWLRSQIGLVGQEPTLFIGSIADNIAYGLDTMPSQEEVEAAAKMANAHDFITRFPDGYATQVGMKGEQLSGGQKQRIAIARAILKNPAVLLLDEATSALDSESEKVVQEALDKVVALKRRTTIIIAHRLSTIRKADKICVLSGGCVAEEGSHSELVARNGLYARLVGDQARATSPSADISGSSP